MGVFIIMRLFIVIMLFFSKITFLYYSYQLGYAMHVSQHALAFTISMPQSASFQEYLFSGSTTIRNILNLFQLKMTLFQVFNDGNIQIYDK